MSSLDAPRVLKPDEQSADLLVAIVPNTSSDPQRTDAIGLRDRQDRPVASETAIDEALEMTFPASDPVALRCDPQREG
jgi:hypothetical protein